MSLNLRPKGRGGPRGVTDGMLIDALRKNLGNVLAASQALGVTDGAVYQRLRNHPELKAIQEDAKERVTDLAKAKLLKRIERDDWNAINLWLTTQAGWSKQTNLANADGSPLAPPAVHIHVSYVGDEVEDVV